MNHQDHVKLLQGGIAEPGGVWVELGSGTGAFTKALAELIGPSGYIYSVDKDPSALRFQEREFHSRFSPAQSPTIHPIQADFTSRLDLPALDGVLMANSLHFVRHKESVLRLVIDYLRPGGCMILVEYNVDRGNLWVPYPLSFPTWRALAERVGLVNTRLLYSRPSRFLNQIYSAISYKIKLPYSVQSTAKNLP